MDLFLIIVGILLIIIGILGCFLPVLPGPPVVYASLLLLQFTSKDPFSTSFLILWAVITIAVTIIDYWVPVYGTKKLGGTKMGINGATAGLLVGLFFGPWGMILGPFIGALAGELIGGQNFSKALKSAFGSFIGFVAGTLMKLVVSCIMAYHFINQAFF
jgi:uncharacterized protein YqgC (DUF456 family)